MSEIIKSLPIDDVYPNPRHYREVKGDAVDKLAASIAVVGQIEPIMVYPDGDIFIIDSGHHRHAAMRQLGLSTIEAIVLGDDEKQSAAVMVASNMHFPETEIERSRGTQLMLTTGVRPADAAALMGADSDTIGRVSRVLGRLGAKRADMAEDMTLERIAAVDEFSGDAEAEEKLLTCPEADWRRVYGELRRAKLLAVAVEEAEAIIAASGVERLTDSQHTFEGVDYIGRGSTPVEGATGARIARNEYSATADIIWYGPTRAEQSDPEEAARREQNDRIAAALKDAAAKRVAFIAEHLSNNGPTVASNALRDFAVKAWEEGTPAEVDSLTDELKAVCGVTPRFYASVLALVEGGACDALSGPGYGNWHWNRSGAETIAYLQALEDVGYEVTDAEAGARAEIAEFLAEDES